MHQCWYQTMTLFLAVLRDASSDASGLALDVLALVASGAVAVPTGPDHLFLGLTVMMPVASRPTSLALAVAARSGVGTREAAARHRLSQIPPEGRRIRHFSGSMRAPSPPSKRRKSRPNRG